MGSRYGTKTRKKELKALVGQRALYECPKCGKKRVKRKGYARWVCRACGLEFAGGAYSPETTVGSVAKKILSTAPVS